MKTLIPSARKAGTTHLGAFTKQTKGGGQYHKADETSEFRPNPMLSND
jgi:hypothetical protein